MRFEAKDGEATLWIYDAIGEMFGPEAVTAKGVRDRLSSLRGIDRLTVRINSPGGMVDEAVAIRTLLNEYQAEKSYKVDGLAASAATILPTKGSKVHLAKGSMWMIHNPWSVAIGDGNALRKAAEIADKYRDNLVSIYSERTKQKPEQITEAMAAETWYTADEALAGGFADSIEDGEAVAAYVDPELFDYRKTPAAFLKKAISEANGAPRVSLNSYRVAIARARQL